VTADDLPGRGVFPTKILKYTAGHDPFACCDEVNEFSLGRDVVWMEPVRVFVPEPSDISGELGAQARHVGANLAGTLNKRIDTILERRLIRMR
jgi:hypothetical protein